MEREQPGARMIGLAEAAQRLALPYQDTHRLLLTGRLRGEKHRNRWYVLESDVDRLVREHQQTHTKASQA